MKKAIKAALKTYGYKMIKPSWYESADDGVYLFNAYDTCGMCHQFIVNNSKQSASRCMMTTSDLKLTDSDVSFIFFDRED